MKTKTFGILTFFLSALLSSSLLASEGSKSTASSYKVNCRAKLWRSDVGTISVNELLPSSETESAIIRTTEIEDIRFELQENKSLFYFKPFIHFPDGRTITSNGFFDATGTVRVDSSLILENGIVEKTDLHCCRDCTYSDW